MSNGLRKKRTLKPDGYEKRFAMQQRRKNERLSENCFVEVFYSLQYIAYTALWMAKEDGGLDFSEKDIKRFYECMNAHNDTFGEHGGISWALQEVFKKQIDFDCVAEARLFPYRAKIRMYGKPLKTRMDYMIAVDGMTEAVAVFLVLAVHTLRYDFAFSGEMVREWWSKCLEVAELYARGMTDEFMTKYLEEETGIKIAE